MKVLVLAVILLLLMPVKIQFGNAQTNASAYDQKLVAFEESIFVARQKSIECMALNIYHEARSLSTAGRLAVAQVTLNRVNSTKYPNTICDVVYQGKHWVAKDGTKYPRKNLCQFSWYCDGKSDKIKDGDAWRKSQEIAYRIVRERKFRGVTQGSTHYHATYVSPKWAPELNLIGRIGTHIFYRWR